MLVSACGLLLSAGAPCQAASSGLDRSGFTVKVKTTDVSDWLMDSEAEAEVRCDADDSDDNTVSGTSKPAGFAGTCDEGKHTSTSMASDMHDGQKTDGWFNQASKNFTVTATAPGATKMRIQFATKPVKYDFPTNDSEWTGGADCDGSNCEICIKGGSCAHPVIPAASLSVQSETVPSVIYFRVYATDGSSSFTTGWDSAPRDKYIKLQICGKPCGGFNTFPSETPDPTPEPSGCDPANDKPSVATVSVSDISADVCLGNRYQLSWRFSDPNADVQYSYMLEIREYKKLASGVQDTNVPIYRYTSSGGRGESSKTLWPFELRNFVKQSVPAAAGPATLGTGPDNGLDWNKTYEWRVKVTDSAKGRADCRLESDWSAWTALSVDASGKKKSFATLVNQPPSVDFTAVNEKGEDCLTPNNCKATQNITFTDASVVYTADKTKLLQWVVDGKAIAAPEGTDVSLTMPFLITDTKAKSYPVTLQTEDVSGIRCSKTSQLQFAIPKPVWNEITPTSR